MRAELDQFIRDWKMLLDSRDAAAKAGGGSIVRQSFAHSINTSFPASLKLPKPPVEPEPPPQPKAPPTIVCPELTLACDSISGSKSKSDCAIEGFMADGHFYRHFLQVWSITEETGCPAQSRTVEITIDPDTCESTQTITYSISEASWELAHDCLSCFPEGGDDINVCLLFATSDTEAHCEDIGNTRDCALSDELTTDDLIAKVIADLPPYCGDYGCDDRPDCDEVGQGCDCMAVYALSDDESSFSVERFKYLWRFTHPMAGVKFDITWCERFIPEGGDESDATYTPQSWSYDDTGTDDTDVFELLEGATNGTTDICCQRCCVTQWPGVEMADLPVCDEATCP